MWRTWEESPLGLPPKSPAVALPDAARTGILAHQLGWLKKWSMQAYTFMERASNTYRTCKSMHVSSIPCRSLFRVWDLFHARQFHAFFPPSGSMLAHQICRSVVEQKNWGGCGLRLVTPTHVCYITQTLMNSGLGSQIPRF